MVQMQICHPRIRPPTMIKVIHAGGGCRGVVRYGSASQAVNDEILGANQHLSSLAKVGRLMILQVKDFGQNRGCIARVARGVVYVRLPHNGGDLCRLLASPCIHVEHGWANRIALGVKGNHVLHLPTECERNQALCINTLHAPFLQQLAKCVPPQLWVLLARGIVTWRVISRARVMAAALTVDQYSLDGRRSDIKTGDVIHGVNANSRLPIFEKRWRRPQSRLSTCLAKRKAHSRW